VTEKLALALAFLDMMVSLVRELLALMIAMVADTAFLKRFLPPKRVEFTQSHGMPRKMLVVSAIQDTAALRVSSKNAHRVLIP